MKTTDIKLTFPNNGFEELERSIEISPPEGCRIEEVMVRPG